MMRADPDRVLAPLKPFQRRTVDHAFERLFVAPDSTARFLVADEVGLGKTLVARGVIARAIDHLWDQVERVDIVYICSNQGIARANLPKLSIGADGEHAASLATRLTMLATELAPCNGRPSLRDGRVNFVSFTPGTSFAMGHATGAMPEREVLFALTAPLVPNTTGLMNLLQGNVTRWEDWRHRLTKRPRALDPGIAADFRSTLRADAALLDQLTDLTETHFRRRRDGHPAELRTQRNRVIGRLRAILADHCVAALQPDLVILDEFQRFKWLLDADGGVPDPAAELFQALVRRDTLQGAPVRTLLLSATPYKLYTTDAEIAQEDHYSDFIATTRFLLGDDTSGVDALRADLTRFGRALRRAASGAETDVATCKARVERSLQRIMCRSERAGASADGDAMVYERCPPLRVDPSCVRQYLAADALFRSVSDQDPLPFWMSAPYLPHFMRGYAINDRLDEALEAEPDGLAAALEQHRGALLERRELEGWQPLAPAHAKLADLAETLLEDGLWQLLWLPPTLPYWPAGGVFRGREAATKALVFSAWNLVPDVICGWLGYEAERRMLGGRLEHYEDLSNTAQLLQLRDRDGRRNSHRLLMLLLPCLPLAEDAHPLRAPLGSDRRAHVRAQVERLLAELPDPVDGPVDRRWEWAWPLLLDPALAELLRAWRDESLMGADGQVVEPPNPDVFPAYVEDLLGLNPQGLGPRPSGLADLLVNVALGSPAVLAARMLASAGLAATERRELAAVLALAFWQLFNRPAVIALLQRGGGLEEPDPKGVDKGSDDAYWRRVLGYCIDGNLQAVLDETWHLTREQQVWGDAEDHRAVAARCVDRIAATVSPPQARVHAHFLEREQGGALVKQELRLRTVFAVRFGDARAAAGNVERQLSQDEVRAAFNSPFRPFVLASTSIGQEGLDFHPWCRRVVHWNLPGNPVDLEQREGRVNRYKGHAIRRNLALLHGAEALASWQPGEDPWVLLFELAEQAARARGDSDLVPCWVAPGPCRVERRVPLMPYTREVEAFAALKRQLAAYRVVFGQPRQQELLGLLTAAGVAPERLREWAVDLSPPS